MERKKKEASSGKSKRSFDSAIKEALREGLRERTGVQEGARARVMDKTVRGISLWKRQVGGLLGAVSRRHVFAFCQQLGLLLECGMPLVKALNTVSNRAENYTLARAIREIGIRVEEGVSFVDAVAEHSRLFPPLVVNMLRAGEESGRLVEALFRTAEHGDRLTSARHKALASLIYPFVLVLVTIAVVAFVFGWTMSQFAPMLSEMKADIPWAMRTLLAVGQVCRSGAFWAWVAAAIVGLVVLYRIAKCFRTFRLLRDRLFLRCPGVRYFIKENLLANFARVFAIMIQSGVSLEESLQAAHDTTTNEVLRLTVERAQQAVREGGQMTPSLERGGVFPPLAYDLSAVGEEAGALGRVFERMADVYEDKLTTDTAVLGKFIQPVIIVVLAFVVGFVMIGFLGTYLSLFTQLTPTGS